MLTDNARSRDRAVPTCHMARSLLVVSVAVLVGASGSVSWFEGFSVAESSRGAGAPSLRVSLMEVVAAAPTCHVATCLDGFVLDSGTCSCAAAAAPLHARRLFTSDDGFAPSGGLMVLFSVILIAIIFTAVGLLFMFVNMIES